MTVSRLPILSISSPVQQNRVIPVSVGSLNLVISNSATSSYDAMTGDGKVVIDAAQGLTRTWIPNFQPTIGGALSPDNGTTNTDEIVATSSCTTFSNNCAAYKCREFASYWYLPAINELTTLLLFLYLV